MLYIDTYVIEVNINSLASIGMITSSSLVLHRLLRSPTMHITKPTVQFSTELE